QLEARGAADSRARRIQDGHQRHRSRRRSLVMLAIARPRGAAKVIGAERPLPWPRMVDAPGAEQAPFRHVIDARQFDREWLEKVLFPKAAELQATPADQLPSPLRGKRLFYLFYEPSTRTRVSFEMAASLLGATVTGMDSYEHRPQDERLEDRIRVLNEYPYDFLLLRYHEEGGASRAAAVSHVPVIQAG